MPNEKLTVREYFLNLIPNLSMLDEIEMFAIQNNKQGNFSFTGNDNGLFFYTDTEGVSESSIDSKLKRAIFKVHYKTLCKEFIAPGSNENDVITSDDYVIIYLKDNLEEFTDDDFNGDIYPEIERFYYVIGFTRKGSFFVNNPISLDIGHSIVGVAF